MGSADLLVGCGVGHLAHTSHQKFGRPTWAPSGQRVFVFAPRVGYCELHQTYEIMRSDTTPIAETGSGG